MKKINKYKNFKDNNKKTLLQLLFKYSAQLRGKNTEKFHRSSQITKYGEHKNSDFQLRFL